MNSAVLMQAMAAETAKNEAARKQYMQPSGSGYSRVGPGQTVFIPDQPPPPAKPPEPSGPQERGGSPQDSETQALILEAMAQDNAFQEAKAYATVNPERATWMFAPLFRSPETSTPDGGDMFAPQRARDAVRGAVSWQSFHDLPPEIAQALYEREMEKLLSRMGDGPR